MHTELIDYPDSVVARYLDSIKGLSPAARRAIDVDIWTPMRDGKWLFKPKSLVATLLLAALQWGVIRAASRTPHREARIAYQLFWAEVRAQNWSLRGRGKIAHGLLAIRQRAIEPAKSLAAYRRTMDAFVPYRSIGWGESATSYPRVATDERR